MRIDIDCHVSVCENGSVVYNAILPPKLVIDGVGKFNNGDEVKRKDIKSKVQWDSLKRVRTLKEIDSDNFERFKGRGK